MTPHAALSKSFNDLLQRRVVNDAAFGDALLCEGIDTMLAGDVDTGKAILRDYIKATVGFEKLGEATDTPAKSLIRMFGPRGNPQVRNLFGIIGYLQKQAGIELHAVPREGFAIMTRKKNPHWGTTLDEFLTEDGTRQAAKAEASTRVVTWQLSEEMDSRSKALKHAAAKHSQSPIRN
jgi:hypothetical protein